MRPLTQISLRAWKQSDAPSVAKYANNENIARNLRDGFPHPYSLKDAENFIAKASTGDPKKQLFAIDLEGESIGSIGAILGDDIYRINAEIGYWLAEDYWGMGIISEALKQLSLYIFNNFPDILRLYAEPFADNRASGRALEKAGFRLEATFKMNVIKRGIIKDSNIYSLLRTGVQKRT